MEVTYTIPEANHSGVKVLEIAINPEERNANIHFDSGAIGIFSNAAFLTLWGEMTTAEKTAVKDFLDALVDRSEVDGQDVTVTDGF